MAKVICALLRYTDDEKSLIIEHEKLRQTVIVHIFDNNHTSSSPLALVEYIKIIFLLQFYTQGLRTFRISCFSLKHTYY